MLKHNKYIVVCENLLKQLRFDTLLNYKSSETCKRASGRVSADM